MGRFSVCLIIVTFLSFTACKKEKKMTLSKAMKIEVDSIYSMQLDSITDIADSICDLNYDAYFKKAKDSIKLQRLQEIEDIIDE